MGGKSVSSDDCLIGTIFYHISVGSEGTDDKEKRSGEEVQKSAMPSKAWEDCSECAYV